MSYIKIVQFVSFLQTNDELLDKLRVIFYGLVAGTRSSSCGPVCQKNPVPLRRLFPLICSKAKKSNVFHRICYKCVHLCRLFQLLAKIDLQQFNIKSEISQLMENNSLRYVYTAVAVRFKKILQFVRPKLETHTVVQGLDHKHCSN